MKWIILIAILLISGCNTEKNDLEVQIIKLNNFEVKAKIADSFEEQEKGLMNVDYMPEDEGMLFIFNDEREYSGFWMKDTLIPLDIIFIDENDIVIEIIQAEPCKTEECELYYPKIKTLKVLEVNKGLTEKIKLKIGDKIKF